MGIMRNLGQFVGHIVAGFRADPRRGSSSGVRGERERHELHRSTQERRGEDGVILRRTVIEEVEMPATPRQEKDNHAS